MYHEKQKGSYCRCHAINNLMGKQLVSLTEFDVYCDAFDKKSNFSPGSSKNKHFFYNNGETDNIFGYILQEKKVKITMEHYDFFGGQKIKHCNKGTMGYIVYNSRHTYCVRVMKGEFWLIDSMKSKPQKLNDLRCIERRGIGVIRIQDASS